MKNSLIIILLSASFFMCSKEESRKEDMMDDRNIAEEQIEDYFSRVKETNNFELARTYLDSASIFNEALTNDKKRGENYGSIAEFFARIGAYDRSLEAFLLANKLIERNGTPEEIANSYNNLGVINEMLGDFVESKHWHRKALAMRLNRFNDPFGLASSYNNLGVLFRREGQSDSAVWYFKRGLAIDSINGLKEYSIDLANLGDIYLSQQDYIYAIGYATKALKSDSTKEKADVQYSGNLTLGLVYTKVKNHERAFKYLERAHLVAKESKKAYWLAGSLDALGSLSLELSKYDEALKYYQESLEYSSADDIGVSYQNIGYAYYEKNEIDSAKIFFSNGLQVGESLHDTILMVQNLEGLLSTSLASKDLLQAKGYADSILSYLESTSEMLSSSGFYKISNYFKSVKKWQDATLFSDKAYQALLKEVDGKAISRNDLASYEALQQELELEKQKSINEKNRIQIIVLLMALFGISSLAFVIHRKRRAEIRHRKEILEKNDELARLNRMLNLARSDIHHRVKNDFHSIASLVSFQANRIENEEAQSILENTGNRIIAMGRVHSLLYTGSSNEEVNIGQFLERTIDILIESKVSEYAKSKVEFIKELDSTINQDINFAQAAQIGMILNELMTNAVKYGINEEGVSKIFVKSSYYDGKEIVIEVQDEGSNPVFSDITQNPNSFGLHMISEVSNQMGWKFSVNGSSTGTSCQLMIPAS